MSRISILSLGNFFAAGQFFLILYIIAPYLATVIPAEVTGLAISLGAVFTLALFPFLPGVVRRFGPQKLVIFLSILELLAMLGLAASPGPLFAVLLAAFACGNAPFVGYQLDLLLESCISDENTTGRIRTAFLTAANVALVIAPLITGALLAEQDQYWLIFLLAAASLVPFILIMSFAHFPQTVLPPVQHNLIAASRCLLGDKDVCAVTLAYGVLQFFFHLVPFYIPLYLHTVLGFSWSELGWMFAVMLLPFALLEYPAGWLADTRFGDKRIMASGFVIAGLALVAVGFITRETPIASILTILVLTRVGGALVEATTEGHFFRRVSAADALSVSLFRMVRPVGALTAPIIASILLLTENYLVFFTVTGLFVAVAGLLAALQIHDMRPVAHRNAYDAPPYPPQGAPKGRG